MPTEPADVVRALWQRIWIDGALDQLGDLVTDPYIRHTREGTAAQSPAEYGRAVGAATDVIRGTKVQIDDMATVDDMVWARMTLHAVNINLGTEVRITWIGQYRVVNGKVCESWVLHESGLDWHD
ncbi:MAG: ester cyclase [Acidimicrobiia bacterium]|nr:ester cyclase [Acidimicrobiia bacterium]